ncbi:MAG: hypothetical protein JST20_13335, partial [Bacteroidetes bacterium]|nr:hypothetical protein [Bacteroidota bacterium]
MHSFSILIILEVIVLAFSPSFALAKGGGGGANILTYQNPTYLKFDYNKTIQGLGVQYMLYTSDGGILTHSTVAIEPIHSVFTKLSASGEIEWEYSVA